MCLYGLVCVRVQVWWCVCIKLLCIYRAGLGIVYVSCSYVLTNGYVFVCVVLFMFVVWCIYVFVLSFLLKIFWRVVSGI